MDIPEEQKDNYWEFFMYERVLVDTEEDLIRDYEYYNKRLKSLGTAKTPLDISIQTVYNAHLKSIKRLLDVMDNLKENGLDDLYEIKQESFFSSINSHD